MIRYFNFIKNIVKYIMLSWYLIGPTLWKPTWKNTIRGPLQNYFYYYYYYFL